MHKKNTQTFINLKINICIMKKLFFVLFIFFSFKTTPQECKGNCENGFGTITYLSGSSYQGEFLYGMKQSII